MKSKPSISKATISRFGFDLVIEIYDRFGRQCSICKSKRNLTIHHLDNKGRNYENKGLKPNNSPKNLILICRKCHGSIHGKESAEKQFKISINGYKFKGREKEYSKEYHRQYQIDNREK